MLSEVVKSMLQNSHRIDAWMNDRTSLMHLRTTDAKSNRPTALDFERASTNTRPSSGPGRAWDRAGTPSTPFSIRSSSASAANNRQTTIRPARSTFAGQQSRPPKSVSDHQKRKALSSSTHNASQPENLKKNTPCVEVSNEDVPVILPFGNLAETPTEKEESTPFPS